ncbi:hypothetical protein BDN72DRAFT_777527 [Pluteus cervinus]|uniref:Uncharacterized protein n=1 Tax=Pluteus cervinus TaxID=181527 RepID=A0ACD3A8Q3_9AGAR|nr:hypothetical protein BDN72DRAFT_777527 [Pluteus cervinus]
MHTSLISVPKIDDAGYTTFFGNGECRIYNHSGTLIGVIPKINGLYRITTDSDTSYSASERVISLHEGHLHLAHINHEYVKVLLSDKGITGFRLDPNRMEKEECPDCLKATSGKIPCL